VERRGLGSREVKVRVGRSRLRIMCMVVMCKMYLRTFVVGRAGNADEVLTAKLDTLGRYTDMGDSDGVAWSIRSKGEESPGPL